MRLERSKAPFDEGAIRWLRYGATESALDFDGATRQEVQTTC